MDQWYNEVLTNDDTGKSNFIVYINLITESFRIKSPRFLGFLHQVSPIYFLCKYVVYMD